MRSGWAVVVALHAVAACGFSVPGGVAGDGGDDAADSGRRDGATDGPGSDVSGSCQGRKQWGANFDIDPRMEDISGDGTPDWALRGADPNNTLPGSLNDGSWAVAASNAQPLDTRPLDGFNGVTTATVRLRATSNTSSEGSSDDIWGVVFWINAGFDNSDFAAIIVSITKEDDKQIVQLYTKTDQNNRRAEGAPVNVTDAMIKVDLVVDMTGNAATMTVNNADVRTATVTEFAQMGNTDRFASLHAWQSDAEFDSVSITNCPD